eukprot:5542986-Amphidinium_carterae.2
MSAMHVWVQGSDKHVVDYFSIPILRKLWKDAVVVVPSKAPPVTLNVPARKGHKFPRHGTAGIIHHAHDI